MTNERKLGSKTGHNFGSKLIGNLKLLCYTTYLNVVWSKIKLWIKNLENINKLQMGDVRTLVKKVSEDVDSIY